MPPYAETVAYVRRIRTLYPHDRHPFDERLTAPSDWLPGARQARERIRALPRASQRETLVGPVAAPEVNQRVRRTVVE